MSMLSMLIDNLRNHADLYDGKTQPPMDHELQRPYLARELREAADTIWELRDDLQWTNAENAKLRELVNILVFCANEDKAGCDGCLINGDDMRVTVPEWMFCDSLIKRLRELGIEVDR